MKGKTICGDLKKKILKETVSTTSTEFLERELTVKEFGLGKLIGQGKFSKVYLARYTFQQVDI